MLWACCTSSEVFERRLANPVSDIISRFNHHRIAHECSITHLLCPSIVTQNY